MSVEVIKCPLKFNVNYKMRPAKLSISNKGVLNCAGKYKVQHLCGYYKFYYNLFENKVRF